MKDQEQPDAYSLHELLGNGEVFTYYPLNSDDKRKYEELPADDWRRAYPERLRTFFDYTLNEHGKKSTSLKDSFLGMFKSKQPPITNQQIESTASSLYFHIPDNLTYFSDVHTKLRAAMIAVAMHETGDQRFDKLELMTDQQKKQLLKKVATLQLQEGEERGDKQWTEQAKTFLAIANQKAAPSEGER